MKTYPTMPDYGCVATFRVVNPGTPECEHDWAKTESTDYITWECTRCPAECGCEVLD